MQPLRNDWYFKCTATHALEMLAVAFLVWMAGFAMDCCVGSCSEHVLQCAIGTGFWRGAPHLALASNGASIDPAAMIMYNAPVGTAAGQSMLQWQTFGDPR